MALIAHTSIPSTSSYGGTSPNVDTTGVKFIAVVVGAYTNGGLTTANLTFIDNKGNTYTGRTIYNGSVPWCRIFYCINPTVGTGHNFSFGGGQPYYPSACIAGFDDTVTGFDVENGGVSSGTQTSKATGSVTPTTSNSLAIAGFNPCDNGAGTITVNGSFTITDQVVWASGQREGSALAYLYTTATSALNPTFTIPTASTQGLGAAIAVFKLASSGTSYSLTAAAGSFSLSGKSAGLSSSRKLTAASGSFTLSGQAATLKSARKLTASVGTFSLTGQDAILKSARKLTAGTGSFTLSGQAASLTSARKLIAAAGSFALTGIDAALKSARKLIADVGSFVLTGQDATLTKQLAGSVAYTLTAATGTFTLTGGDASLVYTPHFDAGSASRVGEQVLSPRNSRVSTLSPNRPRISTLSPSYPRRTTLTGRG